MPVGVAVRFQSAGTAVPPLSLMTSLTRRSVAVSLIGGAAHPGAERDGDATVQAVGEAGDDGGAVLADLDAGPAAGGAGDQDRVRGDDLDVLAAVQPDSASG